MSAVTNPGFRSQLRQKVDRQLSRANGCCCLSLVALGAHLNLCSQIAATAPAALPLVSTGGLIIPIAILSLGAYYHLRAHIAERRIEELPR